MNNATGEGCAIGACCLACRATSGRRIVVAGSPHGPICWTARARCAAGGAHLRLTAETGRRIALDHREHRRDVSRR